MRIKLLSILALAALVFASCSKDDEVDLVWKEKNEAAFAATAASGKFKKIESASKNGFIAYKVIETGAGEVSPEFTDEVEVRYTGWYKKFDWNKGDEFINEQGEKVDNKFIFDTSDWKNKLPTFFISDLGDGFGTALQHMHVGDKWEVWVPWRLGYGPLGYLGQNRIPGYTTLVFEIELVKILEPTNQPK